MSASERRASILDAARAEFGRAGYDGTSTAAIAAAAGCAESVLYRHFPSKLAILRAVLAEAPQGVVRPALADHTGGLAGVLTRVLADATAARDLRVLVSAIAVAHRDPEVAAAIVDTFAEVRAAIVGAARAAQAQGMVRSDLDPEDIAWMWQGLMLGGLLRNAVRADGAAEGAVAAARALTELLRPDAATD